MGEKGEYERRSKKEEGGGVKNKANFIQILIYNVQYSLTYCKNLI